MSRRLVVCVSLLVMTLAGCTGNRRQDSSRDSYGSYNSGYGSSGYNSNSGYNSGYDDGYGRGGYNSGYNNSGYNDRRGSRYQANAGVIQDIQPYRTGNTQTDQIGATALGAVAGGLVGSQIGKGDGRIVGAVAGTLLGGLAGNALASGDGQEVWRVRLRMDNGRTVEYDVMPDRRLREGSRVEVDQNSDGSIELTPLR